MEQAEEQSLWREGGRARREWKGWGTDSGRTYQLEGQDENAEGTGDGSEQR